MTNGPHFNLFGGAISSSGVADKFHHSLSGPLVVHYITYISILITVYSFSFSVVTRGVISGVSWTYRKGSSLFGGVKEE